MYNVSLLKFIGAKDGGGGYNWSCKTSKDKVKWSPDALPVAQPTVSEH